MAIVQRANVLLDVSDADIDRYLAKGYNVVDNAGNIIKEAEPHDVAALTAAYIKQKREIESFKEEIASLKEELEKLKAKKSKPAGKATKNE